MEGSDEEDSQLMLPQRRGDSFGNEPVALFQQSRSLCLCVARRLQ